MKDQVEVARLGIEAEAFKRSTLGRYMLERADILIQDNVQDLIRCEPGNIGDNTKYRNNILIGELVKTFIDDAIAEGQLATAQLQEEDITD